MFVTYHSVDLIRGDELYVSPSGAFSLPMGTVTIQETKAPEGYLINPEVFVRQITPEGNDQFIDTYNQPTIPENILKLDLVKKQEGTDIVIPDAEFKHVKPDGTVEKAMTDENGQLSFKGLQYGTHTLRELNVMDGYLVNETFLNLMLLKITQLHSHLILMIHRAKLNLTSHLKEISALLLKINLLHLIYWYTK